MAKQNVPSEPTIKYSQYELLYGVDYSRDITDVDSRHSPEMVNMISDLGGNPVKRLGFRVIGDKYDKMLYANGKMIGVRYDDTEDALFVESLEYNNETHTMDATQIYDLYKQTDLGGFDIGNINSVVNLRQFLIILCDNVVVQINLQTGKADVLGLSLNNLQPINLSDDIIPTVSIAVKPDGTGGDILYGKNIFSVYQRVEYLGDSTSKTYVIPGYAKILANSIKVEFRLAATGEWCTVEPEKYSIGSTETINAKNLNGEGSTSISITENKITFVTAPTKAPTQKPNVRITYAPVSMQFADTEQTIYKGLYNENLVKILRSGVATTYNSKLIIAVANKIYYSNASQLLLMDDNQWFEVDNEVSILTRIGSYLGIITRDVGTNTIYLASETTETVDSDTGREEVYFTVKPSNAGVGAIAKKCYGSLNDEPVFLSATGLYGVLSNYLSEKYAVNRSARVNRKLCKEPNLETAVGLAYNSYFYIAINGSMYVADSRHRDNTKSGDSSYEFYYFSGLPNIKDMFVVNNVMYFCDDEYLYRWNNDLPDMYKYYDRAVYVRDGWDGEPVRARWCSALDDDGYPQLVKTLQKKGSVITLATGTETGAQLYLNKDGKDDVYVGEYYNKMFSFERISFADFSFDTNGAVVDSFMKKKVKKYRRLQVILENNKAQPFGITSIAKAYTFGSLAKPSPAFTKKKG